MKQLHFGLAACLLIISLLFATACDFSTNTTTVPTNSTSTPTNPGINISFILKITTQLESDAGEVAEDAEVLAVDVGEEADDGNLSQMSFIISSSTPVSSHQVTIQASPNGSLVKRTVEFKFDPKCGVTRVPSAQPSLTLQPTVYVGSGRYTTPPTDSSNNSLIAKQLFRQYRTNSQSIKIPLVVSSESLFKHIQLDVPLQFSFKTGKARGNTATEIPWVVSDGMQLAGTPTISVSTAKKCS